MTATLEIRQHGLPEPLQYGTTAICEKELAARKDPTAGWVWTGTLDIPHKCIFSKFRLLIREYEKFTADSEANPSQPQDTKRLAFADAIEL
jgi:hypothetical protein